MRRQQHPSAARAGEEREDAGGLGPRVRGGNGKFCIDRTPQAPFGEAECHHPSQCDGGLERCGQDHAETCTGFDFCSFN